MIMAEFLFFPTDWSFLQCLMDFEAYRVIRNNMRIRFPGFAPNMSRKEVFTEELTGPRMTNEVLAAAYRKKLNDKQSAKKSEANFCNYHHSSETK